MANGWYSTWKLPPTLMHLYVDIRAVNRKGSTGSKSLPENTERVRPEFEVKVLLGNFTLNLGIVLLSVTLRV